ncbi:MAG: deoxyguanosinetriphosphate triphosphohydrolase, partial [Oceanococcaceae bacterium]
GRLHPEPSPQRRTEYQRDRDRIVHSSAFRRLVYKTQVFINHEGDLFRTRLTHSLEVAQIARTIARNLGLNEDLTETIALAHDLGHTPFGHAGQEVLNHCMREHGGFEHNLQSLRVVDELEHKYAAFRGLNLTFEAREGILKHCSRRNAEALGAIGQRFLDRTHPSAEAQLANLADEIAYNNHDIDDGLRAGLLDWDGLCEVALFGRHAADARKAYGDLPHRQLRHEVIRRIINALIVDLTDESQRRLAALQPRNCDDIRAADHAVIAYSERTAAEQRELKRYLHAHLYHHHQVLRSMHKAQTVLRQIFELYTAQPALLRPDIAAAADSYGLHRAVADYLAGMTDRFALDEHERLFNPRRP